MRMVAVIDAKAPTKKSSTITILSLMLVWGRPTIGIERNSTQILVALSKAMMPRSILI